MKSADVARWVEHAREELEAIKLVVHRARKNGNTTGVFDELAIKGLDVEGLLIRLREDVESKARHPSGVYELQAFDKGGKAVKVERVTVSRDDEELISEDPTVAATRIYLTETRAAFTEMRATVRDAREMMTSANECLSRALVDVAKQNSEFQAKVGEMLGTMYEIASLKKERDDAVQLSADRRATMQHLVTEGVPIIGSLLAKASKKTAPAFLTFFKSIDEQQLLALQKLLRGEQLAAFSNLVDMVQQELKGGGE